MRETFIIFIEIFIRDTRISVRRKTVRSSGIFERRLIVKNCGLSWSSIETTRMRATVLTYGVRYSACEARAYNKRERYSHSFTWISTVITRACIIGSIDTLAPSSIWLVWKLRLHLRQMALNDNDNAIFKSSIEKMEQNLTRKFWSNQSKYWSQSEFY